MTSRRAATLSAMLMSAFAVVVSANASAQIPPQSGCADCHFADPKAPRREHLEAWDRSPHGRERVGCEQCHGGNPRTYEGFLAHARLIPGVDEQSPVNRRNLPATCGGCHTGAMLAFQRSRHHELLQSGKANGPTCATCHGNVEGRVLSAKALESECNECHGAREQAPRAERARAVREEYDALKAVVILRRV